MKTILKSRVVRLLLSVGTCVFALGLPASPCRAADYGVRGGAYGDGSEPFLGAEALFQVGASKRW